MNKQKISKKHCISKVYVGGDDGVAWIGFKFFSFPWFAAKKRTCINFAIKCISIHRSALIIQFGYDFNYLFEIYLDWHI